MRPLAPSQKHFAYKVSHARDQVGARYPAAQLHPENATAFLARVGPSDRSELSRNTLATEPVNDWMYRRSIRRFVLGLGPQNAFAMAWGPAEYTLRDPGGDTSAGRELRSRQTDATGTRTFCWPELRAAMFLPKGPVG